MWHLLVTWNTCSVTSSLGLELVSRTCQEPAIFLFHWNYCRPLKFLWEWFEKQMLEGREGACCKHCCTGTQQEKKKQHCLRCWTQIICFLKSSVKAGSSREIWSHPLGAGKDICISPSLCSRNMRKYRGGCSESNDFYFIVLVHNVGVDVCGTAVEVESFYQYSVPCCCPVTGGRRAIWQNDAWYEKLGKVACKTELFFLLACRYQYFS